MKDLYKSFVRNIYIFSLVSILFTLISNTSAAQWRQTGGPAGAEVGNIVYDGVNTLFAVTNNFLYRSNNNGSSWKLLDNCPSKYPSRIGARNSLVFVEDGNGGIYRSTNAGTNWNFVTDLGNNLINAYAFYNDSVYISIASGIFASPDKGTTWTFNQMPVSPGLGNELFFIGNTMYASCFDNVPVVFQKSTDFGRTFSQIKSNTTPKDKNLSFFIYGGGSFFAGFSYDGIYRSDDSCKTWARIPNPSDYNAVYLKYGNGKLYGFNTDTLYASEDLGNTWTYVSSFEKRLNCIEFKGNRMFAGVYYPGAYRSTNGGYNWVTASNGMKELWVNELFTNGNYVYASHSGTGISRTTGIVWKKYSGDLPDDIITAMYIDSNKFYAASSGDIFRSTNYGLNWNKIYEGSYSQSVKCIYANQGNIFFGTSRRGIFISNDDGATWRNSWGSSTRVDYIMELNGYIFCARMATHIPNGSISKSSDYGLTWTATSEPSTSRNGYIINKHNDNLLCIQSGKLYKSTDLGDNWIKYQVTFEDSTFESLYSYKGILYCGTSSESGKYYLRSSTDNGLTFNKIGDSLPAEVTSVAVKGNYIYAGVKYYSVWRFFKPVITSGNNEAGMLPASFSLKQNYPNPFNPATKIKYDIARLSHVKIVIFDVMGREVKTIVNELLKPGTYEAYFDGSQLASGVYFYKITAGDFSETMKMLMIK